MEAPGSKNLPPPVTNWGLEEAPWPVFSDVGGEAPFQTVTGLIAVQLLVETVTRRVYITVNTAGPHTLGCARAGFRLGWPV